ncbi:MAG TPA: LamG-like jellyroll fold domain-containing protein, partial [Candidatus Dormibacteraeota bacterium]|nr:LamG-like jellyroll fold domain-containing protein [Candidatus Dormibacteraeota bacterium]
MNRYSRTKRTLELLVLASFGAWSLSAQTLTHRYSFKDTAGNTTFADSVGGADGTLNNDSSANSASLDGTELLLDGNGGYATLPTGLINGYSALTVEFWADVDANVPTWTRIFSFGSQDGGNKGSGVDFCPFAGGDFQNLDYVAGGNGAYANSTPGLEGLTNRHVTVVVDPSNNQLYYYNGSRVVSTPHNAIAPLSGVTDTFNVLGKSLYDLDPALKGAIREFRVYQGVLPISSVALNDASGASQILTSPGTIQALHFSAPLNTLLVNQSSQQILMGDFTAVTNLDLISYGGVTYSSVNSGIATINTNGVVKGIAPGTAKVVATYGSLSATNTLTVVAIPPALVHRYNFNGSDASDSVGGANGTLMGNASVSGGQLVLDGSFGTYVDLPGSAINIATNNAVTFEAWATFGNTATWAYLFGFGNTNNGNGVGQLACVPCAEGGGFRHWGITENFGGGGGPRTPAWSHGLNNQSVHLTCVVDPPTGAISIYRDGVLEIAEYDATAPLSNVPTNYGFLGRSFYNADPYLPVSIDEFRIYSGALSPAQVALTHRNGPNVTSIDPGVLSSIVVVPTNYPAYASLVAPVILANYANVPNVSL